MSARILLAEDEEHIAKLIQFKLGKDLADQGVSIEIARDGKEALKRLLEGEWSLLILDVMMPAMDGWSVLREIRSSTGEDRALPVLMLTAKGRASDADEAKALGATRFLRKPFDPKELASVVREMLLKPTEPKFEAERNPEPTPEPTMAELREEFVESLEDRLDLLQQGIEEVDLATIQLIAHKIAGVAANFGFRYLARVAGNLDEWIDSSSVDTDDRALLRRAREFETVLDRATALRADPPISADGSPVSWSSFGSS